MQKFARMEVLPYICIINNNELNNNKKLSIMTNLPFSTKKDCRKFLLNNHSILINFDCGLQLYRQETEKEVWLTRDHEYNYIYHFYESEEKFLNAVWGKIKRGGEVSSLKLNGEYIIQ